MARTGRPRTFDTAATLAQARDLFWSRGYAATSVQDLVDALSLQRGSLYGAFGDKRSLYLKAVELYASENRAHLETVVAADPLLPALRAMLIDPSSLTGASPGTSEQRRGCLIGNTTAELVPSDAEALLVVAGAYEAFVEVLSTAFRRAQATGEVSDAASPEAQAQLLLLVFQGLALVARTDPDPDRLGAAVDAALDGFRRPGPA